MTQECPAPMVAMPYREACWRFEAQIWNKAKKPVPGLPLAQILLRSHWPISTMCPAGYASFPGSGCPHGDKRELSGTVEMLFLSYWPQWRARTSIYPLWKRDRTLKDLTQESKKAGRQNWGPLKPEGRANLPRSEQRLSSARPCDSCHRMYKFLQKENWRKG